MDPKYTDGYYYHQVSAHYMVTLEQGCIWSVIFLETLPFLLLSHSSFCEKLYNCFFYIWPKNPIKVEIKAFIPIAFIGSDQHQLEFSWSVVLQTNILRSFCFVFFFFFPFLSVANDGKCQFMMSNNSKSGMAN